MYYSQFVKMKMKFSIRHFVLLSFLFVFWISDGSKAFSQPVSSAPAQVSQQGSLPIVSFETLFQRHLRELSPPQRTALILQLARTGRFFNVPELWEIDDPKIILQAVNHFPEPLEPPMLQALERVLPQIQTVQDSDRAAAILYRYGKKSGETFLRKRLMDGDLVAATILAENQDHSALVDILKLYSQNTQKNMGVVPYLSDWESPLVGSALLKGFIADQENVIYATALSGQTGGLSKRDRLTVLSLIKKQYNLANPNEPAKIVAAAALIRMGEDSQNKMFRFLLFTLYSKQATAFNKYEVILQMRYLIPGRATPVLEDIIKSFLTSKPSFLGEQFSDPKQAISPDFFATNAAESLAALHAVAATKDISALLKKLHDSSASPELSERTARALLSLGGSQIDIAKLMGNDWLSREIAKRHLKLLPSYVYSSYSSISHG